MTPSELFTLIQEVIFKNGNCQITKKEAEKEIIKIVERFNQGKLF